MTEITEEHLEWATVNRMRQMLADVHDGYKVTHTYALFTSILCWVIQRIRAAEIAPVDRAARQLLGQLHEERATRAPWNLNAEHLRDFEFTRESGVQTLADLPASALLIAVRNAVAHGDGRTVCPINENAWLVGHEFSLEELNRRRELLWRGRVRLRRSDMRHIGDTLARRFGEAMRADHVGDPNFIDDANRVSEEEAV